MKIQFIFKSMHMLVTYNVWGFPFFIIRNKLIGYIPSCIGESLKISHLLLLAIWMFQ